MPSRKPVPPNIAKQQEVEQQLASLQTMGRAALQKLWAEFFNRRPSPRLRRETLVPILGYRIQEKAFGGLKESTARKLREVAADTSHGRKPSVQTMIRPKIGTRYIREFQGKLHEVTVLESGYEYGNKTYRSLSEIAKVVTGTKWSGPAFFGYKRPAKRAHV
jgi:hypothetical protein